MYIDKDHVLISINDKDIKNGTVRIPPRAKEIGDWAFSGKNITSIIIPKTIIDIGAHAFAYCNNLESVVFENESQLYEIKYGAFNGCKKLTKINIPNSIKFISSAFEQCEELKYIIFDKNCHMNSMWHGTFSGAKNLEHVAMPENIDWVGGNMFQDCRKMKFNKYKNAKYLGNKDNPYLALIEADNNEITTCSIHKGCRYILSWAFKGCKQLEFVDFPEKKATINIGNKIFEDCPKLKLLNYPDNIKEQGAPPLPHPERYKEPSQAWWIPLPPWLAKFKKDCENNLKGE